MIQLDDVLEGVLGNLIFAIMSVSSIFIYLFFRTKTRYDISVPGTQLQGRFNLAQLKFLVRANSSLYKSESDKIIDYEFKYIGICKGNKFYLFWTSTHSDKISNGLSILDKVSDREILGSNLFYHSGNKEITFQKFILKKYIS
jgi:hypothetical protein